MPNTKQNARPARDERRTQQGNQRANGPSLLDAYHKLADRRDGPDAHGKREDRQPGITARRIAEADDFERFARLLLTGNESEDFTAHFEAWFAGLAQDAAAI